MRPRELSPPCGARPRLVGSGQITRGYPGVILPLAGDLAPQISPKVRNSHVLRLTSGSHHVKRNRLASLVDFRVSELYPYKLRNTLLIVGTFEIPIHLNPNMSTYKTKTLILSDTGFQVKEEPDLKALYVEIISIEKKRWFIINSLIHIKFTSSTGEKKFFFTAAKGAVADEAGNKKVYNFLQNAVGKKSVDNFDESFKKYADNARLNALHGKINTKEDAIKVIKEVSSGFIGLGIIIGLIGIFLEISMIIDALLFVVLGLVLKYTKSRVPAILLFLLSVIAFFSTLVNFGSRNPSGGRNILLAILILWTSIRGVQATNKLAKSE